jgi:hypothetical protein
MQRRLVNDLQALDSFHVGFWHELFLGVVRDLYDHSVWALRDCIRDAERIRSSPAIQPEFVHLHEIARHVIHSNETLDVAIDTIERLQQTCSKKEPWGGAETLKFSGSMSALEKDMKSIKRRSESLHERLQNEINLVSSLQLLGMK